MFKKFYIEETSKEDDEVEYIIAYGTLMSYNQHSLLNELSADKYIKMTKAIELPGFQVYAYFGNFVYPLMIQEKGTSPVKAELWKITDNKEEVVALLDRYENTDSGLYKRVIATLGSVKAYTYIFTEKTDDNTMKIESNNWKEFSDKNKVLFNRFSRINSALKLLYDDENIDDTDLSILKLEQEHKKIKQQIMSNK